MPILLINIYTWYNAWYGRHTQLVFDSVRAMTVTGAEEYKSKLVVNNIYDLSGNLSRSTADISGVVESYCWSFPP